MPQPKILLTGAHFTPALALRQKLAQHDFLVESLSFHSPKFNRHEPIKSALSLIKLPYFIFLAAKKINQVRPSVVVSFGGYSALPVCLAAVLKRIPLLIHEQTFGAGLTSRLTAVLAAKIAVSWPESLPYFPRRKTVLTGNPIRQELLDLKPLKSNLPHLPSIYITGGHQGSLAINQAVAPLIPQLAEHYQIYHQFGLLTKPKFKHPNYHPQSWFEAAELIKIFASNPLLISRSGINIVTEIAYLNLRAILIPLTTAQAGEQQTNAAFLRALGLAIILPQSRLTSTALLKSIQLAFKTLPQAGRRRLDRFLVSQAADNLFRLVQDLIYASEN